MDKSDENINNIESSTSLTTSDGTEVEPIKKEEWLKNRSIEIASLLEEQDYIEFAMVDFSYTSVDKINVCFHATLHGEHLSEHIDEIISFITQDLENCDMENSYIIDNMGVSIYP